MEIKMNNVKKLIGGLVYLAILSVAIGTSFWWVTDVAALYTENQFTGRMRAFDVEWIDAVLASAAAIACTSVIKAFTRSVTRAGSENKSGKE
jgi:hypothetical protein